MSFDFTTAYFDDEPVNGRVLDMFQPENGERPVALFFVHGGGWRGGARAGLHPLMWALRQHGFISASTDYRLAGTCIQDQLTDVRHGYDLFRRWLREAGRPEKIVVLGSSAGAHLAALLALAEPGACGESLTFGTTGLSAGWIAPVGAALSCGPATFEPWADIFPIIWNSMQNIVGVPYEQDPEAYRRVSPIRHVSASSCPLLFQQAENEHMFPLELTERFAAAMHACGRRAQIRVHTKAEHGFFYDTSRRQQKEAFADLLAFIDSLNVTA